MKETVGLNHTEVIYALLAYKTSHTKWRNKLTGNPLLYLYKLLYIITETTDFIQVRKKTTCFFSVKHKCSQASNVFCLTSSRDFFHYYWNVLCHKPGSFTFCWRYTYATRDVSDIFPLRKPCVVTFSQTLFALTTLQNMNTGYENVSTSKQQTCLRKNNKRLTHCRFILRYQKFFPLFLAPWN